MIPELLEFSQLTAAYRAGHLTPVDVVTALLARIADYPDKAVFISRPDDADVIAQAAALKLEDIDRLPLFGIPFVVKDNIDVAGMQTTAACPDYAYTAQADATAVARLLAQGAILLGKTNLDQFATGLNGTRCAPCSMRIIFRAAPPRARRLRSVPGWRRFRSVRIRRAPGACRPASTTSSG
jgi:allophanate hydrolase